MNSLNLTSTRSNFLAALLLVWGCSAMIGELLKNPTLKALGLASCAAPYTKVFCQAKSQADDVSFETFAVDFTIHYQHPDQSKTSIPITPETYQQLLGPYQRRNVYGAVLAYGPALPEPIQQATFHYALISPGTIRHELGIPDNATDIVVEMNTKSKGRSHQWLLNNTTQ